MANMNYTHGRCKFIKDNDKRCKNNSQPHSPYCGPHETKVEGQSTSKPNNKEEDISIYEEQFWSQWEFVLTGTGTRKLQNADNDTKRDVMTDVVSRINELKEEYGDGLVVMSGGAEGFDSAVIAAAIHCNVPYVMALPSDTYGTYYWRDRSLTGYNRIEKFNEYVEGAEQVIYVCDFHKYGKANKIRNSYMVDWADEILIYNPTGDSKGTNDATAKAKKKGMKMTDLS